MKHIILIFAILLSSTVYAAEKSMCGPAVLIATQLVEAGERPLIIWVERDHTTRTLFANPQTKAWTLVQTERRDSDVTSCTMRNGTGFMLNMTALREIMGEGA